MIFESIFLVSGPSYIASSVTPNAASSKSDSSATELADDILRYAGCDRQDTLLPPPPPPPPHVHVVRVSLIPTRATTDCIVHCKDRSAHARHPIKRGKSHAKLLSPVEGRLVTAKNTRKKEALLKRRVHAPFTLVPK